MHRPRPNALATLAMLANLPMTPGEQRRVDPEPIDERWDPPMKTNPFEDRDPIDVATRQRCRYRTETETDRAGIANRRNASRKRAKAARAARKGQRR